MTDLDIDAPNYFSINKRRQNSSVKSLRRPGTQSKDRDQDSLPDVVKQTDVPLSGHIPKRIGTYFEARKKHFARTPMGWNQQSKTPQNLPFKPSQNILNEDKVDEKSKTAEHLAMMKKLEEFKVFLQKTNVGNLINLNTVKVKLQKQV